jgi:uncharacterized protein GlcG (DUF336 family)
MPEKLNNIIFFIVSLFILTFSLNISAENKPYLNTRSISADLAQQAASIAYKDCTSKGYKVAVAVVDRRGELMSFIRNPLASPHTTVVSQRKAYTSATYQSPTTDMMDREINFMFTPGVLFLGGGLPISVGGHFYGAIGVSGAPGEKTPGDVDDECAQKAIDVISEILEFSD